MIVEVAFVAGFVCGVMAVIFDRLAWALYQVSKYDIKKKEAGEK